MKHKKRRLHKKKNRIYLWSGIVIFTIAIFFSFVFFLFLKSTHFISPIPAIFSKDFQETQTVTKRIKKLLKEHSIAFSNVYYYSDSSYGILLLDNQEVFITSQKDLASQVSTLQTIVSRLTIEGKSFKRLDLRFDKPYIVFK